MPFKLNQRCSDAVNYCGVDYQIDMSFDNVLDVIGILKSNMGDYEKSEVASALLLESSQLEQLSSKERNEIVNLVITDLIQEETNVKVVEYDLQGNPLPGTMADLAAKKEGEENPESSDAGYDLEYDATYIYTSFYQAYGIDLHQQFGKLHYQAFNALLRDLPEDTQFGEIIRIRSTKLSDIKDLKERSRMKRLKLRYKLPDAVIENDEDDE